MVLILLLTGFNDDGRSSSDITFVYEAAPDEASGHHFTRRLVCQFEVSVYDAIKVHRICALPYQLITPKENHLNEEDLKVPILGQLSSSAELKVPTLGQLSDLETLHEDDYCLLVIDLENLQDETFHLGVCEGSDDCHKLGGKSMKRIVVPFKRIDLPHSRTKKDVPINGQHRALLRKLYKTDDFSAKIDRAWYWTKKELLDNLQISWSCDPDRNGILCLSEAIMDPSFLHFIRRRNVMIDVVSSQSTSKWPVGKLLDFTITVSNNEPSDSESFVVRALPALHIADDELGFEFADMMCVDGCLQAIYKGSDETFEHRFSLMALSPCLVQLLVHVEGRSDGTIHSHSHPLKIDFVSDDDDKCGGR